MLSPVFSLKLNLFFGDGSHTKRVPDYLSPQLGLHKFTMVAELCALLIFSKLYVIGDLLGQKCAKGCVKENNL